VNRIGDGARVALAGIRLFNGLWALLLPMSMGKAVGVDPEDRAVVYPLRMFGVRTVALGLELLVCGEDRRRQALREGVAIHASDAAIALTAGVRGDLRPRSAALATTISTVNTILAVTALLRR
jgi:hypothetical protein